MHGLHDQPGAGSVARAAGSVQGRVGEGSASVHVPQKGRLFVFAFIINRRMQGFSEVKGRAFRQRYS